MHSTLDMDAPRVTIIRRATHTARRPLACDLCRRTIAPGTVYELLIMTEDGEFRTVRQHRGNGLCAERG